MTLVFAIPSKGRLKEQAESFLASCGLTLKLAVRGYAASIDGLDAEVRLMSSSEIAGALLQGAVHAGVVGHDLIADAEPAMTRVALLRALGFGPADVVVAVPQCWLDVSTMADLDAVCHDFRVRNGRRLRVATKYHALTRAFFDAHGLDDYAVTPSQGATEGAPGAGSAEAIVDITTTGATLKANQLKVVDDGVILKSEAWFAASRAAPWDAGAHAALAVLDAAIATRAQANGDRVLRATPGMAGATALISAGQGAGLVLRGVDRDVEFACSERESASARSVLLAAGAARVTLSEPEVRPLSASERFVTGL
jgi:ATP phosphoribosyltransferase